MKKKGEKRRYRCLITVFMGNVSVFLSPGRLCQTHWIRRIIRLNLKRKKAHELKNFFMNVLETMYHNSKTQADRMLSEYNEGRGLNDHYFFN